MSLRDGIRNLLAALAHPLPSSGLVLAVVLLVIAGRAAADYAGGLTPTVLVHDGAVRRVRTRCSTVGELLDDVGLVVGEHDLVLPDRRALLEPQMTIEVQRARPVTLIDRGVSRTVHTHVSAVGDILSEAGLELLPGDRVRVDGEWLSEGELTETARIQPKGAHLYAARSALLHSLSSRSASPVEAVPVSHIELERAVTVHLDDNGREQTLRTTAETLGEALVEANVRVYLGDQISLGLDSPLADGQRVHIRRAVPVVVIADGRSLRTRTQRATVGEVLAELGVSLVGQDFCEPSPQVPLAHGLAIRVVRVVERTIVEQDVVPHETEWVPEGSLELDQRRVDDVGADGLTRRRYKQVYHDGQPVERILEEEWLAQAPRPRRISYGTRIVVRTLDTPHGPVEYWRKIRTFLTAYTAATCGKTPDHPQYGITRLGWKMRRGIVAVDPLVIRLRTPLYVPGYGPGIAGDTGGLIKGRHIDLGYEEGALLWHYHWGYVYLRTPVPPSNEISYILPDYPRER